MLAAVGHETQKATARVLIFAIFVEMDRKLGDSARQDSNLHLRGARIGVVAARFGDFVQLLALRKHN